MIQIDFSEPSTWRGLIDIVCGGIGIYMLVPIVFAMMDANTTEQLQFLAFKSVTIASAIGLTGQTIRGFVGTLFSDKGASNV